jgi:hypothetical protein
MAAAAILNFTTMLPLHYYYRYFHEILQVYTSSNGNQEKGCAEVSIQKIQDGGRRHFEFFRLL